MTKTTKSGPLFRAADAFRRADLAFLASRVSLVVPVFAMAHLLGESAFAEFSRSYHIALFLSTIILYGAHEAYIVNPENIGKGWLHLVFNAIIIGVAYYAFTYFNETNFDLSVFVACVLFRSMVLYIITLTRGDTIGYFLAVVGIGSACILVFILRDFNFWTVALLAVIQLGILIRHRVLRWGIIVRSASAYPRSLVVHFFYMANNILSATYIQGALFLYAFFSSDDQYVIANHFIYVINICFIFQDLIYRRGLAKFAGSDMVGRQSLFRMMGLALTLGTAFALLLSSFTPQIESVLFGQSYLSLTHRLWLAAMLVIHASNFAWSSFLVGRGLIKIQFRFTLLTAVCLPTLLAALAYGGIPDPILGAMVATSAILSVTRGLIVWRHF